MNLDVYNTHMELYPYVKDSIPVIEKMYTATDKFTGNDYPCGYIIEDGKLYLPRGTHIAKIENICNVRANYITESDPYESMSKPHHAFHDPRDSLQEESIKFLKEDGSHQLGLNLVTGFGKTMVTAFATTDLNERTLIITPNEGLKWQWISTYHKNFDYRPKHLMNITGSAIMDGIIEDMYDPADVYFVNHQTLRSFLTNNNGYMLHKFFKKLNVGIKVYDESHMEFGNILLIDFFSNTNRTWYLTATFDRSDKTESACFKRAFSSVVEFGYIESTKLVEKHVIYHVVNINSHISPKDRAILMKYPGFTGAGYGRYSILYDPNDTAYLTILKILDILENVDGKILIFVPLIEAVDKVVDKLKKDCPSKSVAAYHSKISADEKESAEKKDIIVSTIKSLGTGKDIKELRAVINLEPIASKVIAEQMFGRIRPYMGFDKDGKEAMKETFFFDIVDICITPCNYYFRARFKKIQTLAKKVVYLNMDK